MKKILISLFIGLVALHMASANEEFDEELASYNKAIESNTKDAAAYYNRGYFYLSQGKLNKIMADRDNSLVNDTKAIAEYVGDLPFYDKAIADFIVAIKLDPTNTKAYYNRGMAYFYNKNYDKAIADYTKLLELNGGDILAYLYRAKSYIAKSEWDKAIEDCNKALEISPYETLHFIERAIAYEGKADLVKAMADFHSAVKVDTYMYSFIARANFYLRQNEIAKAIIDFHKALVIDNNNNYEAYNGLSKAYDMLAKKE